MKFYVALLLLFFGTQVEAKKKISIIGCFGFNCKDSQLLFDEHASFRDCIHLPYVALKRELITLGHEVVIVNGIEDLNDSDVIISFHPDVESINHISIKASKIYISLEPPIVNTKIFDPVYTTAFDKVIMLCQDYADGKKFYKCNYPQARNSMIPDLVPFSEKKLCTMVVGNKSSSHPLELYTERVRAIEFFENNHPSDFDLYGLHWPSSYRSYRGSIVDKIDCLKKYKFALCYENSHSIKGYITEKIFDAFFAGCVPIYFGAPDITDYIPKECFIDRRNFKSNEDLYAFLENITQESYQEYITHIRSFLSSSKMELFSIQNFVKTIISHV